MATLYYAQLFTLDRVSFRFESRLPGTGIGSESESGEVNVNKPLPGQSASTPPRLG